MTMIYLLAGEPSGDQLGAHLMRALKSRKKSLQFLGVGGHLMAEEGLESRFPISEIAVMGLAEILPHALRIKKRIAQTVRHILDVNPDILVTIDSPGFTLRVVKALKTKGFSKPVIHYVAPTVWAWRPERASKLAKLVDHLMCLLPFEPPYFEEVGLKTTFVGHPVLDIGIQAIVAESWKETHGIQRDQQVGLLLLGSRKAEVERHLLTFAAVAKKLYERHPELYFVLPTVPHLEPMLTEHAKAWPFPARVITSQADKFAAYKAAAFGLAVSGTVSLELAVAQTPSVIAYKMNAMTFRILKRMVRVRYASLINILEDRPIVPEFIQKDCHPAKIYQRVLALIDDKQARQKQLAGYADALSKLQSQESAADVVLQYLPG